MNKLNTLTKKQQLDIKKAIKTRTPIIITGEQGTIGKTYTADKLRDMGAIVYEPFECLFIKIG